MVRTLISESLGELLGGDPGPAPAEVLGEGEKTVGTLHGPYMT